jgi:hypothetical protein
MINTKKSSTIILLILAIGVFVAGAIYLPIPANLDFQVLYFTNQSFINGIDIYNHSAQVEFFASLWNIPTEDVFVLPFPYPPWYVLTTFYLAWLPETIASRVWFEINIIMLIASTWLLTNDWKPKPRLFSFFVSMLYIPTIGSLYVGQYNFPLLLGGALFIYATQKESVKLTALAFALLTFKPHIGIPLAMIMFIFLLLQSTPFAKRTIKSIVWVALFLFAISFLADSAWLLNYIRSLIHFQTFPSDTGCEICASMPLAIYYLLTGQLQMASTFTIAGILFLVLFFITFIFRKDLFTSPIHLFSISLLIIFLSLPYILNYDYTLILIPIFTLAASPLKWKWLWVTLAYTAPQLLIASLGRNASFFLPLTALLLWIIFIAFQPILSTNKENLLKA